VDRIGLGGVPDIRQRDREFATEGGIAGEALNHRLQTRWRKRSR